jgi:hypothetical protein
LQDTLDYTNYHISGPLFKGGSQELSKNLQGESARGNNSIFLQYFILLENLQKIKTKNQSFLPPVSHNGEEY